MSRDGRRAYFTNSPYASWDEIFYPHGVDTSMARIDADTEFGGRPWSHGSSGTVRAGRVARRRPNDFRALRVHQTRLQAVDA